VSAKKPINAKKIKLHTSQLKQQPLVLSSTAAKQNSTITSQKTVNVMKALQQINSMLSSTNGSLKDKPVLGQS
jgi:hypothetical protein